MQIQHGGFSFVARLQGVRPLRAARGTAGRLRRAACAAVDADSIPPTAGMAAAAAFEYAAPPGAAPVVRGPTSAAAGYRRWQPGQAGLVRVAGIVRADVQARRRSRSTLALWHFGTLANAAPSSLIACARPGRSAAAPNFRQRDCQAARRRQLRWLRASARRQSNSTPALLLVVRFAWQMADERRLSHLGYRVHAGRA